jgi:hypothetical protein
MDRVKKSATLLLAFAITACTRAPQSVRALAGCYAVSLGPWAIHPLSHNGPFLPPDTLELETTPVLENGIQKGYQVRPNVFPSTLLGNEPTSWREPTWRRSDDSVRIVWSNGFGGVGLSLITTDSGLVGRALSWTDVVIMDHGRQIPWPTASVYLHRSRCASDAAA